jgi:nucleoid-associated protein YgaU
MYTVKAGDSLSEIAKRFLGKKGQWKKLYDMNRDVIEDPDNVKVGTVLRVS